MAGGEVAVPAGADLRGGTGLGYGPLHRDTMLSPRVTPPIIGVGLLEAVPDNDILAGADPGEPGLE